MYLLGMEDYVIARSLHPRTKRVGNSTLVLRCHDVNGCTHARDFFFANSKKNEMGVGEGKARKKL